MTLQDIIKSFLREEIPEAPQADHRQETLGPTNLNTEKDFFAQTKYSNDYNELSIKRINSLTGKFIYNYFERNEKSTYANESTGQILDISDQNTLADDLYNIVTRKKSRFVKLSIDVEKDDFTSINNYINNSNAFENATEDEIATFKNLFEESDNSKPFDKIKQHAVYEGNLSNYLTTAIEYFDTFADRSAYRIFSSSIVFSDLSQQQDSTTSLTKRFIENLEQEESIFSLEQKKHLIEVMGSLNTKAIQVEQTELSGLAVEYSNLYFKTAYNNLFIADIIDNATITLNHIYADEKLGLLDNQFKSVRDIQNEAISNINQNITDDTELFVTPVPGTLRILNLDITETTNIEGAYEQVASRLQKIPTISPVGILITVYEERNNSFFLIDRKIILDVANFPGDIAYEKIKYGENYLFEARQICLVDSIFNIDDDFPDPNQTTLALGTYIVLSDKVSTYVECIETVPPEPPNFLTVDLDFESRKPMLSWHFPNNTQRDIKKFHVFKRKNLNSAFTLVRTNNFDNSENPIPSAFNATPETIINCLNSKTFPNRFVDYDFNMNQGESQIYAVISEDAHGMTSGYSTQILVRYDKLNNRFNVETISRSGAPQPYPNLFVEQDFFIDVIKQSNYNRCNVFFDPEYYKLFRTTDTGDKEINYIKFTGENQIEELETEFPYQFHFINVDQQLDQVVSVNIANKTGLPEGIDPVEVTQNFSFDFNL